MKIKINVDNRGDNFAFAITPSIILARNWQGFMLFIAWLHADIEISFF